MPEKQGIILQLQEISKEFKKKEEVINKYPVQLLKNNVLIENYFQQVPGMIENHSEIKHHEMQEILNNCFGSKKRYMSEKC